MPPRSRSDPPLALLIAAPALLVMRHLLGRNRKDKGQKEKERNGEHDGAQNGISAPAGARQATPPPEEAPPVPQRGQRPGIDGLATRLALLVLAAAVAGCAGLRRWDAAAAVLLCGLATLHLVSRTSSCCGRRGAARRVRARRSGGAPARRP
jgi:hypothetical protein